MAISVSGIMSLTPLALLWYAYQIWGLICIPLWYGMHIKPHIRDEFKLVSVLTGKDWHCSEGTWHGEVYEHCFHCLLTSHLLLKPCVALEDCPREEQHSETVMASFEFRGLGFSRYFGIYWGAFKLAQRLLIKGDYEVGSAMQMVDSTAGRNLAQWNMKMYLFWLAACDSKKLFLEAYIFEL